MDRDRNERSGIFAWIVTAISVLLFSISCADPHSGPLPRTFTQRPITEEERTEMFHHIEIAIGTPYVWGGDTLDGMDCSGLIQWAYREMGHKWFLYDYDEVVNETTAHNLFHNNTVHLESVDDLHRGDFIFFDENGDGRITHNAVFDKVDVDGSVWVYDAYSVSGKVVHRIVDEFESKGPLFGRPLILVLD